MSLLGYSLQLVHLITKKNIKNGSNRFVMELSRELPLFEEVNDTKDFEALKMCRTIEWEYVFKFLKNLKFLFKQEIFK